MFRLFNLYSSILRTVFVKVLETRIVPLASALTLNPSPKKGYRVYTSPP